MGSSQPTDVGVLAKYHFLSSSIWLMSPSQALEKLRDLGRLKFGLETMRFKPRIGYFEVRVLPSCASPRDTGS